MEHNHTKVSLRVNLGYNLILQCHTSPHSQNDTKLSQVGILRVVELLTLELLQLITPFANFQVSNLVSNPHNNGSGNNSTCFWSCIV